MCQYQGVTCELIEVRENFHMTWIHPPRECEERVESGASDCCRFSQGAG